MSLKTMLFAGGIAVATASSAFALTPQQQEAFKQSCSSDYMRFCSAYEPNTPQVEQCFASRMKDLSPRCQQAISSFQKQNPEGRRR